MDAKAKTVLVVDDDPDIRETIRNLLQFEGYRVVTAIDGEGALRVLASGERPCVILLDVTMPGMSGRQFRAAQLRDVGMSSIPVVLLS